MRKFLAVAAVVLTVGGILAAVRVVFRQDVTAGVDLPGPIRSLDVEVDAGVVEVVGVPGDAARIRRAIRFGWQRPRFSETVTDGALVVRGNCRADLLFQCRLDYRIEVPAGVTVRARSNAGNLIVSSVSGDVDAETNAGRVRLHLLSGKIKARSDAGSIEGNDLQSPYVDVRTDAGQVELVLGIVPDRVAAETAAGSIDLTVPDAGYRVETDSQVGNVKVDVTQDPQSTRTITAETEAGNIRIRKGPAR